MFVCEDIGIAMNQSPFKHLKDSYFQNVILNWNNPEGVIYEAEEE
jgi:hypothetical protein